MTPEEIQAQETAVAEQAKKDAEEAKVKEEADAKAKAEEEAKAKDEKPVGELGEKPKDEPKENLIPESVFLGEKKGRKAAEKRVKELEAMIEAGGTKEEISDDIAEIAEEHNIDKSFLNKLAKSIKAQTEKDLDTKYQGKFDKKEKEQSFDEAFEKAYATGLKNTNGDFDEIADKEKIKQLALHPDNAKKSISKLLEETYGRAIPGKRTIEGTKPGGGKDPEPLDFDRANRDNKYLVDVVLKDPDLKKEYNQKMLESGF